MFDNYFTELADGSHQCKECDKIGVEKVYKPKTAKTNLIYHLQTKHSIVIHSKPAVLGPMIFAPMGERERAEITNAFIKWVVTDLQAFSICEDSFFIEFVQRLNPRYQIPGRKALRADIFRLFETVKATVKEILEDIPGAIGLTADLWTSVTMESYCGITAHFLDRDWRLQHLVLDVLPMPYPHTGEAIKDALMATVLEFSIEKKILTLTTDNASSMIKAFGLLADEILAKHGRVIYHVRCGAHIINLAVQDGLKNMFATKNNAPSTAARSGISTRRKPPAAPESTTLTTGKFAFFGQYRH